MKTINERVIIANQYEDMSVIEALEHAGTGNLLLPDIQREYCWDIHEIEALFESIVDDYPIGSCIFWKTTKEIINQEVPNLYNFFSRFERDKTTNHQVSIPISQNGDIYVVLDGQQRITSMNIALYGSYSYYKGGRGRSFKNPDCWVEKELYYNLDFYQVTEEDDEHPQKRFIFLTQEDAQKLNVFKVKNLLLYAKLKDYKKFMINQNYDKQCRADLVKLFQRLHSNASGQGLVHYFCINEDSYDKALDIFVRVNSTGKKLTKSDLLFSTLINGWKEGKSNIDKTIKSMNSCGDGFKFNRDYLMRLGLVLVDADPNLKIKALNVKTVQKIHNQWEQIAKSARKLAKLLADIGMCDENLISYNATMPIAYFLYRGGEIKDADAKKETKKFLSVAFAKGLFGVASNAALSKSRNALQRINCKNTTFSLKLFENETLTGGRTFTVNEKEIDRWLDNYEKGPNTYVLLSLLYPNLKLSQVAFHQDHCHPYSGFSDANLKSLNLTAEKVKEWQKKRNLLPNLQFLEGTENESKNKTPLKEWVANNHDFDFHPTNVSLELQDFDIFFDERRKLIKKELKKNFEVQ